MAPRRRHPGRRFVDPKLLQQISQEVAKEAERQDVRVALIGGAAMHFYGSPRLTGDVDFVADEALADIDQKRPVKSLSFGGKRYITVGGVPVDLIVREDEYAPLYEEALERADETDEGFLIVSPEYLAAMKFATKRAKDHVDLLWLLAQPDLVDKKAAEAVVRKHLGGRFAADEFRQATRESRWRRREFEDLEDVADTHEEE